MLARLSFNAPLTLSLVLLAAMLLVADQLLPGNLLASWFAANEAGGSLLAYVKMFTYVLAHQDWSHLFHNASLILVLGPMLEEKYGAPALTAMMLVTSFLSAAVSLTLFATGLMGASGIAFMFIVLSSFSRTKAGTIPLTAVLVIILYLAKELAASFGKDQISQLAHIMGGGFGAVFGYFAKRQS